MDIPHLFYAILFLKCTIPLIAHHLQATIKYQSLLCRKPPLLNVTHCHNVTTMGHSGNGTSVENSSTLDTTHVK